MLATLHAYGQQQPELLRTDNPAYVPCAPGLVLLLGDVFHFMDRAKVTAARRPSTLRSAALGSCLTRLCYIKLSKR